jgi:signal transduction histidine kinase
VNRRDWVKKFRTLDLQVKVTLTLVAVILPTFLIITLIVDRLTQPYLEEEVRQIGIASAKTFALEIEREKTFARPNAQEILEKQITELLSIQPNILRFDVYKKTQDGKGELIASSHDFTSYTPTIALDDRVVSRPLSEESVSVWELSVPITQKSSAGSKSASSKLLGNVRLQISLQLVGEILAGFQHFSLAAGFMSVVILFALLSFFLRRTIQNDRLLRRARSQNTKLYEQLHDAQRQVMNNEKLAVMGQLTANFAHEIGTPLNAIGGHLQLLRDELSSPKLPLPSARERIEILNGQVSKIEHIVRELLQTTAKPQSQTQLVDLNRVAEKTLSLVHPRADALGVEINTHFDRSLGPVRLVPIDLEQILLNLVNNSLDALQEKWSRRPGERLLLELDTRIQELEDSHWAEISIRDSGMGISSEDLQSVVKPFFTTKAPGQGTGLGLTICQQLVKKYDGVLDLSSKEGSWTEVKIRFPFQPQRKLDSTSLSSTTT